MGYLAALTFDLGCAAVLAAYLYGLTRMSLPSIMMGLVLLVAALSEFHLVASQREVYALS